MNALRTKIIKIARQEIGYIEEKGNMTKYGEWFGFDGVAWCGIFVSWVYWMAGVPLGKIGFSKGFAGCATAVAHFLKLEKEHPGKWITNEPEQGDIVFFDFDGNGSWDHVGLFDEWINKAKGTFESVEGNTSDRSANNGGMVMERVRYGIGTKTKVLFVKQIKD